ADAFTFASELRKIRRDFAPDREDPHTHVTAEVIAEAGRPQRDPSQITSAHLAAPTSPDEDMGKLMDALRAGEGVGVAAALRDMEHRPPVSITGFESTAKQLVDALDTTEPSPSPGRPEVRRDAVTALPRSRSSDGTPGSVRYLTKEGPHAAVAAGVDAPRPKALIQKTVPMARPKPVHHYTEPMAGRPGRFAHPAAHDARTPEPQAIDNPRPSRSVAKRSRSFARMKRRIERVVPLRALPVALALGFVALVGGILVLRTKGVDLTAGANAPAEAPARIEPRAAPVLSMSPPPAAPTGTVVESTSAVDAGGGAVVLTLASASSTEAAAVRQPPRASLPRANATTSSPVAVPAKRTTTKPSDIGFE
ncbi:MAG: hypothetical protein JWO86_8732, partial [Myxococcaceae bacterium]|nr:hypothetical protein [Myxococcaceae bacterium]